MFAVAFYNLETGQVLYYTGKAGEEWLSSDATQAFFGYSLVGAVSKGMRLQASGPAFLKNCEVISVVDPGESEGGTCD